KWCCFRLSFPRRRESRAPLFFLSLALASATAYPTTVGARRDGYGARRPATRGPTESPAPQALAAPRRQLAARCLGSQAIPPLRQGRLESVHGHETTRPVGR